ncbi:hypothetical protein CK203_065105 [Vitis vinifera]|uniref:Retrotransposon gag domain-containing protein n=1 Tax=Vitis vinifera TaxID=29760 RepID=A0A438FPT3_VITVI|nr:hypothetical protein CK203_065105 [Vitis vinifera]
MCGGDDHLAWKHPVSLEACRGLRTAGGLDSPSWTRVRGRLTRVSDQPDQGVDQRDMDSQVVTVDQFVAAMASIQEAIAGLGQRIDGQQAPPQDGAQYDSTAPPPPPLSQPVPHPTSYVLHSQTDATPLPVVAPIQASEDAHAPPVVSLPTQFRMPEIERYTGIGCPKIHLRLYSSVMRAHGLDEAHLIMLFPMSLSGAAQRWFASLDASRQLEALRQGPDESVTSFISRWREKIAQIVDRPSEKDQISMILRSLQPRFARHLMGFPHTDFGSLVQALYGIEEGIARGLWPESSPSDSKGKKSLGGQRPGDVSAISSVGLRSPRRYQTFGQTSRAYYPQRYAQYRPPRPMIPTYLHQTQSLFLLHRSRRGLLPYILGLELHRLLFLFWHLGCTPACATTLQMDLHCSYHQGPGHDTDHCARLETCYTGLDRSGSEPIVLDDGYEVDTVGSQTFTPFSLISDWIPFELTPIAPSAIAHRVETTITRRIDSYDDGCRATCIVFSDDDLPPDGLDHVRPLYITVGCSGRRVPSVLLDNGSALNVCPLATAIALGFRAFRFWSFSQTVLRIPTSFNLLLGRPWIHVAGAIPSSLHQKVKFIHDGQVITVRSTRDVFAASEPVLQISHSEDDLLLTGFTFDEIQTLEIEDFCRDFVAMTIRQQGPSEFIAAIDHDTTFGLGFIPTEADYRHMARLRKERVRARLSHTPFDYPIRPYRMSLADYFVEDQRLDLV